MESRDEQAKILSEHLAGQYRIYRDEVKTYLSFAAGSTSLLPPLLIGELVAATYYKYPLAFALMPITVASYFALLGLLWGYAMIAAHYSSLVEDELNELLGSRLYLFESYYVGPKPDRPWLPASSLMSGAFGEFLPFVLMWAIIFTLPVAASLYSIYELWKSCTVPYHEPLAILLAFFEIVAVAATSWAVAQIISLREHMNSELRRDFNLLHGRDPLKSVTTDRQ